MSSTDLVQDHGDTSPSPKNDSTALRTGTIGVAAIVFFVISSQAPLTGIGGAAALTVGLGNGPGAPGTYLLVGIVIMLFAVGFVAMSRSVGQHGGFYAYVNAGLGQRLGGAAAWLAILAYISIQAAMYGLYGSSLSYLLEVNGVTIPWWALAIITMVFVQFMGSRNIELGAKFLAVLVILEVSILLAFALKVLFTGGGPQGLNLEASFSPNAIMSGAPGIAIMFAIAAMYGFEATAIYSQEAKNPKTTVARATYISVCIIALFLAFVSWTLVSYYGPDNAQAAALEALASGNTVGFAFGPLIDVLGPWAGVAGEILLLTSLLAGVMAMHNSVNRYFHSLALYGSLPAVLARTNRHLAPSRAAMAQTIMVFIPVVVFAGLGLDPVINLFSWLGGVSVAALLAVYVLTAVAVVAYFRRTNNQQSVWTSLIAPVLSGLLLIAIFIQVIVNFSTIINGDTTTAMVLLGIIPIFAILGFALEKKGRTVPNAKNAIQEG